MSAQPSPLARRVHFHDVGRALGLLGGDSIHSPPWTGQGRARWESLFAGVVARADPAKITSPQLLYLLLLRYGRTIDV